MCSKQWVKYAGEKIHPKSIVEVRDRFGAELVAYGHSMPDYRDVEYRIVEEFKEPVREILYGNHYATSSLAGSTVWFETYREARDLMTRASSVELTTNILVRAEFENGVPVPGTLEVVP